MKPCGALAVAALVLASACLSASAHPRQGDLSKAESASGRQLLRTQPQGKPEEDKPEEDKPEVPEEECYYVKYQEYKDAPEPKYGYTCEEVKDDYGNVIKYKCCKEKKPEPPKEECYYVKYQEYKDAPEPKYGYKCVEVKNDYGKTVKYKCCKYTKPPRKVCITKKFGKHMKTCCKVDDWKTYKHNKLYNCFRKYYKGKKITFCCKRS